MPGNDLQRNCSLSADRYISSTLPFLPPPLPSHPEPHSLHSHSLRDTSSRSVLLLSASMSPPLSKFLPFRPLSVFFLPVLSSSRPVFLPSSLPPVLSSSIPFCFCAHFCVSVSVFLFLCLSMSLSVSLCLSVCLSFHLRMINCLIYRPTVTLFG